jgi:DNA-binding CsgD family transcriptional regulator
MIGTIEFPSFPRRSPSCERVSPRESAVLEIAEFPVAEIAAQLGISPNTVKSHLRALYDVSGAETRAQLVFWRERRLRMAEVPCDGASERKPAPVFSERRAA